MKYQNSHYLAGTCRLNVLSHVLGTLRFLCSTPRSVCSSPSEPPKPSLFSACSRSGRADLSCHDATGFVTGSANKCGCLAAEETQTWLLAAFSGMSLVPEMKPRVWSFILPVLGSPLHCSQGPPAPAVSCSHLSDPKGTGDSTVPW